MKNKIGLLAGAVIAAAPLAAQAAYIAQWTFETDTIAVNNAPAADVGTGTAGSIGMNLYATPNVGVTTDDVLAGKSSDTGANGNADTSQEWRVRGQAGANGAANGWSSLAPIGAQGATFTTSTANYTGPINVSFDWYSTTQGEANLQLEYTNNFNAANPTASTWINVPIILGASDGGLTALTNSGSDTNTVTGSYVSDNALNNGSLAGQDWFPGLTATISDPAAAGNPNFAIAMVNASTGVDCVSTQGTALNNSSGNWRFDNVTISATAVATPEPASLGILGIAGVALFFRRRRV